MTEPTSPEPTDKPARKRPGPVPGAKAARAAAAAQASTSPPEPSTRRSIAKPKAPKAKPSGLVALWRKLDDVDRYLLQEAAELTEGAWIKARNPDAWADLVRLELVVNGGLRDAFACTKPGRDLVAYAHREKLPDTARWRT